MKKEIIDHRIYLDNAATTQIDEDVLKKMLPYLASHYGNPSSMHHYGREARIAVEEARKKIAACLRVKPNNIIFTSGGTESNNAAVHAAIVDLGCNYIITSAIEHHAILHAVHHYADAYSTDENKIGISLVKLFEDGSIDQNDLRRLLETKTKEGKKCFVTLMHANNETGQFTEIRWISSLCKKYGAIFHSDCVQTIGHLPMNLSLDGLHMASASAHKFHGPKGIGLLYVQEDLNISPLIYGGGQERNRRAGTENVASIVGMEEALHLFYEGYLKNQQYISGLKAYLATIIKKYFPDAVINSGRFSLYSTLSVSFPKTDKTEMLLLQLDQKGICVSGGSACSGGKGSHVMEALGKADHYDTIRFSLSKHNTREEMDRVVEALVEILQPEQNTVGANENL